VPQVLSLSHLVFSMCLSERLSFFPFSFENVFLGITGSKGTKPMMKQTYTLKTYRPGTVQKPNSFYVLNKGLNSGKPLSIPCPNCFEISTRNESERAFFYWLCYSIWQSKAFEYYLRGSVIPFIIISEVKQCINQAAAKAQNNLPEFERSVKLLQEIEILELNYQKNLELFKDAKRIMLNKLMK
jgi:hypothetical protein